MIKALIVDDEQHAINSVENLLSKHEGFSVCGTAKTVEEAIELTNRTKPDLVFLDVVLDKKTGFDYLNALPEEINFSIIFTTAYNQYAVRAFEYSVMHYLLKPIEPKMFEKALERTKEKISREEQLLRLKSLEHNIEATNGYKWLHIPTIKKSHRIFSKNILFIKSFSNYAQINLTNGEIITASKTLKYYADLLKGSHFYRVHKSYLINLECIKEFNAKNGDVILTNGENIKVAERRRKDFALFLKKRDL